MALVVLAEPLLYTLFQYGKYSPNDVAMASYSLQAYALGLTAFMLIKVLASGFFSRKDMRTPVRVGIIAMVANMGLNVAFVVPLHYYWQVGHAGLALATAASAFLNAGLLLYYLRKQGAYGPSPGWMLFSLRIGVANAVMLLALLASAAYLPTFLVLDWFERAMNLAIFVVAGMLAYIVTLVITGLRLRDLRLQA